jgi:hypothetical protein
MKALSVRQPWAWAIIHDGKDIENRTWKTGHRGIVAIHAPAKVQSGAKLPRSSRKPRSEELSIGAVIGVVDIVDVVTSHRSKWFAKGGSGFVLANPRALARPIPCKGKLGVWNLPASVAKKIEQQLKNA